MRGGLESGRRGMESGRGEGYVNGKSKSVPPQPDMSHDKEFNPQAQNFLPSNNNQLMANQVGSSTGPGELLVRGPGALV